METSPPTHEGQPKKKIPPPQSGSTAEEGAGLATEEGMVRSSEKRSIQLDPKTFGGEPAWPPRHLTMHFDFRSWATIIRKGFGGPFLLRRWIYLLVILPAFLGFRVVVHGFRFLDNLLIPRFRKVQVREPVFIYASARSGTTLFHRLLSLDKKRFTHVKLFHTIFQSGVLGKIFEGMGRLDQRLGGLGAKLISKLDHLFFGVWEGIHPMGLNQAEEDEAFFIFSPMSPAVFVLFPWIKDLPRVSWLDRNEESTRRQIMGEYRSLLQRHLWTHGQGSKQYLGKSVFLSSRMESLHRCFTDSRFIYLVRNPYESIPSALSMYYKIWELHSPDLKKDGPEVRELAKLAMDYYRMGFELRHQLPKDRFIAISYHEMIKDPEAMVQRIYGHFDWKLGEEYQTVLNEHLKEARKYKTSHRYSLEEFGLTKQEVHEELKDVFEAFGFDRGF